MIKAETVDKHLVIQLLSKSFQANQSVNYIVRQDEKRLKRIAALMDYSYEMCNLFGDVWLSEDRKACALVMYPHEKRTTFKGVLLDIKLIFEVIGLDSIKKALDREVKIKEKQPKQPMAYLWFIGVDPTAQHKGIGSKLLCDIIAYANQKNLPVFLETSTLENLPWYERFGFKIFEQLELTYILYFLKRDNNRI